MRRVNNQEVNGELYFREAEGSSNIFLENEQLAVRNASKQDMGFLVPSLMGVSIGKKRKIYAREFIKGTVLGTRHELKPEFEAEIPLIAQHLITLQSYKPGDLPVDKIRPSTNLGLLINQAQNQATTNKNAKSIWLNLKFPLYARGLEKVFDISELKKIAKESNISQLSFNHCEVSPWHLIKNEKGLYLIGWDWASNKHPKHYDLAHAVARIAIAYGRQDLAEKLAKEYWVIHRGKSDTATRDYFGKTIYGLLAIRTAGELRDLIINKNHAVKSIKKDKNNLDSAIALARIESRIEHAPKFIETLKNRRLLY